MTKIIKKFYYNYYLLIIAAVFFINIALMGFQDPIPYFLLIICVIFLLGSILLMWRITIYEDGIYIKHLVSLGRNKRLRWDDIKKINIVSQYYRGVRLRELFVVPKKGKPIKFFRLGVQNYKSLSKYLEDLFENQRCRLD